MIPPLLSQVRACRGLASGETRPHGRTSPPDDRWLQDSLRTGIRLPRLVQKPPPRRHGRQPRLRTEDAHQPATVDVTGASAAEADSIAIVIPELLRHQAEFGSCRPPHGRRTSMFFCCDMYRFNGMSTLRMIERTAWRSALQEPGPAAVRLVPPMSQSAKKQHRSKASRQRAAETWPTLTQENRTK